MGQEGTSNVNLENVYFGYREQLVTRGKGGDKLEVFRGVQQGSLVSDTGLGGPTQTRWALKAAVDVVQG